MSPRAWELLREFVLLLLIVGTGGAAVWWCLVRWQAARAGARDLDVDPAIRRRLARAARPEPREPLDWPSVAIVTVGFVLLVVCLREVLR